MARETQRPFLGREQPETVSKVSNVQNMPHLAPVTKMAIIGNETNHVATGAAGPPSPAPMP